jgi:hypothetical protein
MPAEKSSYTGTSGADYPDRKIACNPNRIFLTKTSQTVVFLQQPLQNAYH